ncbi:hypothetical protein CV093_16085 [Oceanobacillus sp. 143]|nr:hypothetical protein CV093_16085 [Oceanobacillus sp. 143]
MYYANTYPDEVEAIIGIDPTLPQALEYFGETAPAMPAYFRYMAPTGIARLALYITPENFLPIAEKGTYSEANLRMTKAISAWKGYNKTVVTEANEINNNIDSTIDMTFPSEIPVMIFTKEDEKGNEEAKSNITFFHSQLNNCGPNKLVIMGALIIYIG